MTSAVLMSSCATLNAVDLKAGVGEELRPSGERRSAQVGVVVKDNKKQKFGVTYRGRLTEMAEPEHGVFVTYSVPLWSKK